MEAKKPNEKIVGAADARNKKEAYRRLKANPDFDYFYSYVKTCYNSYIESAGEVNAPKHVKEHLLYEAATLHKIISYIDRQAS